MFLRSCLIGSDDEPFCQDRQVDQGEDLRVMVHGCREGYGHPRDSGGHFHGDPHGMFRHPGYGRADTGLSLKNAQQIFRQIPKKIPSLMYRCGQKTGTDRHTIPSSPFRKMKKPFQPAGLPLPLRNYQGQHSKRTNHGNRKAA